MTRMKKYWINLALAFDQLWNAMWGGDRDETTSSRIGRVKLANGGKVPRHRILMRYLDKVLEAIDPGHSVDAIEKGEGSDGIRDLPKDLEPGRKRITYFVRSLCHDCSIEEHDAKAHEQAISGKPGTCEKCGAEYGELQI